MKYGGRFSFYEGDPEPWSVFFCIKEYLAEVEERLNQDGVKSIKNLTLEFNTEEEKPVLVVKAVV